ncbi:MAG: hypothetical protein GEV07_13640 [Streptosporangiales bacterium]|nr:hypothetical protein [Streptosporangiales bacterium]
MDPTGTPGTPAGVRAPLGGFACLLRGQAFVLRRPRLWPLGLLPALVTFAVLITVVVLLAVNAVDLVTWATPFADDWSQRARTIVRWVVALAVVALALWVSVLLFVTLTLLFGQPFYEALAKRVDEELGNAPREPDEPWHRGLRRSVWESAAMLLRTAPVALAVFAVGLVPAVGQVAAPVLGAIVGGRFLALELLAPAMERRGKYLPERLAFARSSRAVILGFGIPAFVAFLVPVLNVVLMPGAVAGATLLVREHVDAAPAREMFHGR